MAHLKTCPDCGAKLVPDPKEFLAFRESAGMTQRDVAAALKVKASHIAYLENGRRNPSGDFIIRWRKFVKSKQGAIKKHAASELKRIERAEADERKRLEKIQKIAVGKKAKKKPASKKNAASKKSKSLKAVDLEQAA